MEDRKRPWIDERLAGNDVAAILALIASDERVNNKSLISVWKLGGNRVEVRTGTYISPLSAWGLRIEVAREGDDWKIESVRNFLT